MGRENKEYAKCFCSSPGLLDSGHCIDFSRIHHRAAIIFPLLGDIALFGQKKEKSRRAGGMGGEGTRNGGEGEGREGRRFRLRALETWHRKSQDKSQGGESLAAKIIASMPRCFAS